MARVKVSWPTLSGSEYDALHQEGMLWEFCPVKGLIGDETTHTLMIGEIALAKGTKGVLLRNNTKKIVPILGYTKFA